MILIKESFFVYYGVMILVEALLNPIKPEGLYDTIDQPRPTLSPHGIKRMNPILYVYNFKQLYYEIFKYR